MGFDKAKIISAAEKYLAQGKIPSAIGEYRRIVEHDPHDYSALNTLGDLYSRTKKTPDAINCFQLVADHYREQGFTLKAIAIYKKISRLDPNLPAVAERLAVLYEQQGHFVEAREQYLAISNAYARTGKMRESLAALRRIADLDPNNIDIRLRLGEGFLREDLREEAADAFTEAGERLLARDQAAQALEAYTQAQAIRPRDHATLHGLAAAHSKLGSADEAAAVLERAVGDDPKSIELCLMLARAYLDAEDATAAEEATERLVALDTSNYPLFFEVARLFLQRGDVAAAVRVLGHTSEPALAGKKEQALLKLLNEALARDPEQIEALRLLLRIYTWQRDDDRMRVTLERLAEAAQTHHLIDEERRALEHLVRLVPFDQSYHDRLHELGGAPGGEDASAELYEPQAEAHAPAAVVADVTAFESVIERGGDGHSDNENGGAYVDASAMSAPTSAPNISPNGASEFEWNSVAVPEEPALVVDPNASFADLNEDLSGADVARPAGGGGAGKTANVAFDEPSFDAPPTAETGEGGGERVRAVLAQELESVDFYLAQGYADIARDTLDMLERQYGASEEITLRRLQLPQDEAQSAPPVVIAAQEPPPTSERAAEFESYAAFEFTPTIEDAPEEVELSGEVFISAPAEEIDASAPEEFAARITMPDEPAPAAAPTAAPAAAVVHHDLADIFGEYRDEVEAGDPVSGGDYETHYNTGTAYREMGLLDQAVEELQAAITLCAPHDGTARYLQCCNLLGHCFMQKGMPRPAAMWFKKGLDTPGHSEDEYQALRYELGAAYEEMGDLERAIEIFSEVYGVDVNYRGVTARLRDLQAIRK